MIKKVSDSIAQVINFLQFLFVGLEVELSSTNMGTSNAIMYWQEKLNRLFPGVFEVHYDSAVEITFARKLRLNKAIEATRNLFETLNNDRGCPLTADTGVGIHIHFSHDMNYDFDETHNRVNDRVKTYEDILIRLGARTLGNNGTYHNRLNIFCRPLSETTNFSHNRGMEHRNMIRKETSYRTTEFRFIDSSLETWRILSIMNFIARFYAYCAIHKTVLRKDGSNNNIYNHAEYEYHKLHSFCNQMIGLEKEDLHNIMKLYNGTFEPSKKVHKTRKERREALHK